MGKILVEKSASEKVWYLRKSSTIVYETSGKNADFSTVILAQYFSWAKAHFLLLKNIKANLKAYIEKIH